MTKLHQLLDTKNRKEQERRVEYLKQQASAPIVAITIVLKGAMVDFVVLGRPAPEVLLQALDAVRDDIIKAMARAEAQQEGATMVPEGEKPQGLRTGDDPTLPLDPAPARGGGIDE